jgi:hypothetical protein
MEVLITSITNKKSGNLDVKEKVKIIEKNRKLEAVYEEGRL